MNNTFYKFCLLICCIGFQFNASGQLIITAVYDGPLPGGTPKGVELFATADIPDLGVYQIKVYYNGNTNSSSNIDLTSGVSLVSGEFYYLTKNLAKFSEFFETSADQQGSVLVNGDDAIELRNNGALIDVLELLVRMEPANHGNI